MNITFDLDFSPDDRKALIASLGCTEGEFTRILPLHARAALAEYVEAYLGRRAFSSGKDILEYRLSLLIEYAYDNRILSESEVSRLFQTTLPVSRSLLRSAISKYRYRLQGATAKSAKAALETATWDAGHTRYSIEANGSNLVEILNQRLAAENPGEKPIGPDKECIDFYLVAPSSYDCLCETFKAKPVKRK